jgi:uroporphyrinogen-III decarboxylase
MIDRPDAIHLVAELFDMASFTVVAMTEPELVHRAMEKVQLPNLAQTEAIAAALPGRLWRITGPEYASPPYLPPALFHDYVTRYDTPMVEAIQRHGGFARIHSHGRLHDILDHIAATGCVGLDPIEPLHQGDVTLAYVRQKCGKQMVLFGNIEASDLENLPADAFRVKVATALREGTAGEGRGFVLMPSSCPFGRVLSDRALTNYRIMVEMAERFALARG